LEQISEFNYLRSWLLWK